jgi:hypothetical protein
LKGARRHGDAVRTVCSYICFLCLCYKRQFQNKARHQTGKHPQAPQRQPTPKPSKAQQGNHTSKRRGQLIRIRNLRRRPRQAMLKGKATGFNEKASHTTLQHRIVSAEAHAKFPQHSFSLLVCCCVRVVWFGCACCNSASRFKFKGECRYSLSE